MRLTGLETARRFVLWAAICCAAHVAPIQPAGATGSQEPTGQTVHIASEAPAAEADTDADVQRMHRGFDILARSFTKKKRSELINLKTYTDAEWAQLERDVEANNVACRKGDAEACLAAGDAYVSGDGVWIVPAIAYILYTDACNAGLGEGCRAFVDLADTGYGYPEGGYEETNGLIEKACKLGDLVACDRFAEELRGGSAEDIARSDALLDTSCKSGGMAACNSLGRYLLESGRPEDAARATGILDAACRGSGIEACRTMARHLEGGPDPDPSQVNLYRHIACYAGSADDCAEMGTRAWRGTGLAADRELAQRYFAESCRIEPFNCGVVRSLGALPKLQEACGQNDAKACADLGHALLEYGSPEYDADKALALLEPSCLSGVGEACVDAATMVLQLDRLGGQSERFAALLETGCAAGHAKSCFERASSLESDIGTPELERAVALYSKSCDAQYPAACEAETRFAGLVPSARIRPAGENFTAPLPTDEASDLFQPSEVMEVCFTGSERFRGKTYVHFACDRSEKGIGSDRARPGQAPWQALLWRPQTMFGQNLGPAQRVLCGGSLIAMGWVLTAAHCLNDEGIDLADKQARSGYRIRLGVYDPGSDGGVSYPILRVIRHPQFDPKNKYAFDVALIEYDPKAGSMRVRPGRPNPIHTIALDAQAVGERKIAAGMPAYAFGWGWTAEQKSTATDYLQIMKLDISTEAACTALTGFTKALSNAALCAKGKGDTQTCYGDSGGPLVYYGDRAGRPVLIGIVSAGLKCGTTKSKRPSQYTRVAKVKDWIATYVPGIR